MSPFDGVNDAGNDQILAVSMQCWYLFLLVQNLHSCVQILIFVCKLALQRNKKGCGITPKRYKIGCLRLFTSAAYVQIMHKKWAKLVQVLHFSRRYWGGLYTFSTPLIPSNSTSLTASISTRWSKVVSRPYFNKKKEASQPLSRARLYMYYI